MSTIQTVLGPIMPEELGVTYSHDHLLFCPPPPYCENDPDLRLDSVENAIQDFRFFKAAGGQALVEMSTVETGRSPEGMKAIAEESGVHIIAATGHHAAKFSGAYVADKTAQEIAAEMIRDLTEGMNGTQIQAGLIKIGTSKDEMTASEQKVIHAAGQAHSETGAPISTHTEAGTFALEQIESLRSVGVEPEHTIIGHLDRKLDWDYHKAIAETGAYMSFDQLSKEKYWPDIERIAFIKRLTEAGHGHQVLLSCDLARKSYWPSYGFGNGPGLTYILWRFVPWMLETGIPRDAVADMLIRNPARAFTWKK